MDNDRNAIQNTRAGTQEKQAHKTSQSGTTGVVKAKEQVTLPGQRRKGESKNQGKSDQEGRRQRQESKNRAGRYQEGVEESEDNLATLLRHRSRAELPGENTEP